MSPTGAFVKMSLIGYSPLAEGLRYGFVVYPAAVGCDERTTCAGALQRFLKGRD